MIQTQEFVKQEDVGVVAKIDNFLSLKECADLITSLTIKHKEKCFPFRDTIVLQMRLPLFNERLNKYFNFYNFKEPSNQQLVIWPKGSKMGRHFDLNDKYSTIVYLNDDFEGGETIIEGLKFKPKAGSLLLFSNGTKIHEVKEIINGERYTLATWYV